MKKYIRIDEYKVLFVRIVLVYFFYTIARLLFYFYNADLLQIKSFSYFLKLCYHGLTFDTSAILYVNLLFILLSILPLRINTSIRFQKVMFYLYFITNLLAFSTNFIDFIYYKHSLARTTLAAMNVIENETNKASLFLSFIVDYWHVFVLFFVLAFLWIFLYKKIRFRADIPQNKIAYFSFSTLFLLIFSVMIIAGIRGGDLSKSTRPINLLDASRHVKNIVHADIVLNTPFAIIRTVFSNNFKKVEFPEVTEKVIAEKVQPIKFYKNNPETSPNVVLIILESYGREYSGAFNKFMNIKNHKSHTPFIDSLAQHSLIFSNAYANGRQSIHGMSSIIAGIPTYKDAFTSSPYPKQKIESLVSTLERKGYSTSFFHGAANGSMGFLGFSNILGIDHYFGRNEYNNDIDFDGYWGIWDEPFLQFMKTKLDHEKAPFFSTVFTISSHEPYIVPEKYKDRFKEGDIIMHKCVEYTDYALQRFFDEAKKSTWYENTIFVLVADHGNQVFYQDYNKTINRFTVPILFFKPNSKLVGNSNEIAQQIDIYPTILDLIGYNKPFRSWGRSLVDTQKKTEPFAVHSLGNMHHFMKGNYISAFDGKNVVGFYSINDKALEHNLIQQRNAEMDELELETKAFYQDYMNRVIDKKLTSETK
jgi:phosphoglycerol transferase MdoB-like AlkP superfamily enzyme